MEQDCSIIENALCHSFVLFHRLLAEGICHEKNIPSISSINRIIRDKAILQRRSLDSLSGISMCDSSDQEEVSISKVTKFLYLEHTPVIQRQQTWLRTTVIDEINMSKNGVNTRGSLFKTLLV